MSVFVCICVCVAHILAEQRRSGEGREEVVKGGGREGEEVGEREGRGEGTFVVSSMQGKDF